MTYLLQYKPMLSIWLPLVWCEGFNFMAGNKGTITFKDAEKNFSTMRFPDTAGTKTKADVETLKAVLVAFTDCHIRGTGYVDKTYYVVAGADITDSKAIVTCQDGDGNVHKYSIPGYNGTPVQDKDGYVMEDADRDAAVTAIGVFTGLALAPLRSPYIVTR